MGPADDEEGAAPRLGFGSGWPGTWGTQRLKDEVGF